MIRISIDMGSCVTKIYMPGCGVVLSEATCIAVEETEDRGEKKFTVKACGDKAKALFGRAAQNTHIVNPVGEGNIIHENLAAHLLSYFLEKIEITPRKARHTEAIFILPCGIKAEGRQKYQRLADECGIEMAYFTLSPFAAVAGHNVMINESTPMFSLDIGHTITNIAVFSQDGIIAGLNVNLGGNNIDVRLIDELAENTGFKIGALTAERLKNTVGSLISNDNKLSVFDGRDISTGAPVSYAVTSDKIYATISAYIDKIIEYVKAVIAKLPPDVASEVMHGGVYLSGGMMKLDGLPEYISEKLGVPVNMPEEPQYAAVIGGGAILANDELCERFTTVSGD